MPEISDEELVDSIIRDINVACRHLAGRCSDRSLSDEVLAAATHRIVAVVDDHIPRVLEATYSHYPVLRALYFIAKMVPTPASTTDLAWLDFMLHVLLDIAIPHTQLSGMVEQAFLLDMNSGISERVADSPAFIDAFRGGQSALMRHINLWMQ